MNDEYQPGDAARDFIDVTIEELGLPEEYRRLLQEIITAERSVAYIDGFRDGLETASDYNTGLISAGLTE